MVYQKKLRKKVDVKKMIIYTNEELLLIKKYKITSKVYGANCRFSADKLSVNCVFSVLKKYQFRCLYCDCNLSSKTWRLDHFFSKAMGGKNVEDNLAPACKWCNMMKNALDGHAFLHRCKIISENNFFKKALDEDYYVKITSEKQIKKKILRQSQLNKEKI